MASAGLKSLAGSIPAVIGPALARRGKALAVIIAEWERIVGPALAEVTRPLRLGPEARGAEGRGTVGAALVVEVTGAAATELLHRAPVVIERINGFLGLKAVERLRLVHGSAARTRPAKRPATLDPEAAQAVAKALEGVESPELKAALARFGGTLTALADRG